MLRSSTIFVINCLVFSVFFITLYFVPLAGAGLDSPLFAIIAGLMIISIPWAIIGIGVGAREVIRRQFHVSVFIGVTGNTAYLLVLSIVFFPWWRGLVGL